MLFRFSLYLQSHASLFLVTRTTCHLSGDDCDCTSHRVRTRIFDTTTDNNGHLQVNIPQGMLESQNSELEFAGYFILVDDKVSFGGEILNCLELSFCKVVKKIETVRAF